MSIDIDKLIEKYLTLMDVDPVNQQQIVSIEKELGIILPNDFKKIAEVYAGNMLGPIYLFNFETQGDFSIVEQTQYYRQTVNLPHSLIPLYEESGGFIVMVSQDDPSKASPVIYCATEDIYNLIDEKPLQYDHQIFPSFADFFEYLLEREEAERETPSERF